MHHAHGPTGVPLTFVMFDLRRCIDVLQPRRASTCVMLGARLHGREKHRQRHMDFVLVASIAMPDHPGGSEMKSGPLVERA